ncbi:phage tail tip lysozyme [Furfurilactobacillus entadae]|uniref:phage tail tip lysozyme n=1 Tax=Furfurilactobacillus entadae TaxID=2922307 RepID=UPI0038B395ED
MAANAKTIYDYLTQHGANSAGSAGALGNMQSESGIQFHRLERDVSEAVGLGNPAVGLGIMQWTATRHTNLLNFAKDHNKSWDDPNVQLDFMWSEVQGNATYKKILAETDVDQAANDWLTKVEVPENLNQPIRAQQAEYWYAKLAGSDPVTSGTIDAGNTANTSTSIDNDGCDAGGDQNDAAAKGDDYPKQYKDAEKDSTTDSLSYYNRECTSFVAWRLKHQGIADNLIENNGNGGEWAANARKKGMQVDHSPSVGCVAEFETGDPRDPGHVAIVAAVKGSKVDLEEYNWATASTPDGDGSYHTRTIDAKDASNYLHFKK